jgi:hypothetical protein
MPDDRDPAPGEMIEAVAGSMPIATWSNPTAALQFVEREIDGRKVRILQQRWDIYEGGLLAVTRSEWRDVPLATEE